MAKQLFTINGKQKLFDNPEYNGYIDSLDFDVDGIRTKWNLLAGQSDICRIQLNKPLLPKDSISVTTPFHVKIPAQTSRLGHQGQSYQISQWYPKPAVYDRNGWHYMSYLDQGEFYSEFGEFDVHITLPANYVVGACGNLQTEKEIARLNSLAADTSWIFLISSLRNRHIASSDQKKTLHYTASNIHDFTWVADKRFHVRKSSVKLPYSGRSITTWTMFKDTQPWLWRKAPLYIDSALWYFSMLVGDFPYSSYVAVQSALGAGSGMEYPGMAVIGDVEDSYQLDEVIAHEVCHSWFYSALGSNERQYPYMDEGITSMYEARYMNHRYPEKKLWEVYFKNRKLADFFHVSSLPVQRMQELEWLKQARLGNDQEVNLSATDYNSVNYSIIIYSKAAMGFNYLRAYLGDSLFDATMQDYYRYWQNKHPQPEDLRCVFEKHVSADLSWFFDGFLGTTKRLDYQMVALEHGQILVKNNGELVSPLVIAGTIRDSVVFEKWVTGFAGQQWISVPSGNYTELKIDPNHLMPEINRLNNNIKTKGLFPKADPVKVRLLFTFDEPDKRYLMYIPSISWTRENGLMPGLTVYNSVLLPRPVEYTLSPFFTLKHFNIAGSGQLAFTAIPYNSFIRMIKITLDGSQFAAPGNQNYHKLRGAFDFYLRNSNASQYLQQKVYFNLVSATDLYNINHYEKAGMNFYMQLGYVLTKETAFNPFCFSSNIEWNKHYQKASIETNYTVSYNGRHRGLDIRLFAGTMLKDQSAVPFYEFAVAGRSGRELYLYPDFYPDRFGVFPRTFWTRQMSITEGGLASPVNDMLGYRKWLVSLSLLTNLPGKMGVMPVKPYATALLSSNDPEKGSQSRFLYEAGIKTGIWNLFEVYFPIWVASDLRAANQSLKYRIRFVLKLDSFIPVKFKPTTL